MGADAIASLGGSLDYERLRAATEAVLAEPLYWFPVRHHSPNVARHMRAALLARRPKVVFLEANGRLPDPGLSGRDADAWEALMLDVAASRLDRDATTKRLRALLRASRKAKGERRNG